MVLGTIWIQSSDLHWGGRDVRHFRNENFLVIHLSSGTREAVQESTTDVTHGKDGAEKITRNQTRPWQSKLFGMRNLFLFFFLTNI